MKRKTFLLTVLSIICLLCLSIGSLFGCNSSIKTTLVDWENSTDSTSFGTYYQVENVVYDIDGNAYNISAKVVDSNKKAVSCSFNKFIVSDYNGYTITYTFKNKGEVQTKKVELSVTAAKPMIRIDGESEIFFVGGSYLLPACTITDYIDQQINEYTTQIYKIGQTQDQIIEHNQQTHSFKATEVGEYYAIYTATNSKGVSNSARLDFTVENVNDYLPYVVKVDEQNYSRIYHDLQESRRTYVKAGSGELPAFSGEYEGGAIRYTAQHGYDGNFRVKNIFPQEVLEEMLADGEYTHVSLWWAYSLINKKDESDNELDGEIYLLNENTTLQTQYDCFFEKADALGTYYTVDGKVWNKLTITIEEYISLVARNNYKNFILFGLANRGDLINDVGSGIYIGDITFETPQTLYMHDVNSITAKNYTYNGGNNVNYVKYAAEIPKFTGDYSGNAVSYKAFPAYSNLYRVNNKYTEAQLNKLKENYNKVSVYVAFSGMESMRFLAAGTYGEGENQVVLSANFREKAGVTNTDLNVWNKWTVSIDDYIELIAANNNEYFTLFGGVPTYASGTEKGYDIYVGDVVFEYVEPQAPSVIKIDATNYKQFTYNGNANDYTTFIQTGSQEIVGFSGNYTGNAVKYKVYAGHNGQYRINNPYSQDQLNELKTEYDTVSMYIAYNLVQKSGTSGNCYINHLPSSGNSFLLAAGISGTSHAASNQQNWVKVSISLEQYISLVSENNYEYCVLFRTGDKAANVDNTSGIFVGDIVFEKSAN